MGSRTKVGNRQTCTITYVDLILTSVFFNKDVQILQIIGKMMG
jgi:hypothetical protein